MLYEIASYLSSASRVLKVKIVHAASTCILQGGAEGIIDVDGAEPEPWADEVTTLLLGLVLMSHKRYLQAAIFPEWVEWVRGWGLWVGW